MNTLRNITIINTSSVSDDDTLSAAFIKRGAKVLNFPMIEIVPVVDCYLKENLNKIEKFNIIIFTSKNGIKYFFDFIIDNLPDVYKKINSKFIVIGTRTAKELQKYNLKPFYISKSGSAKGMLQEFSGKKILNKDDSVLLVLGSLAPDIIENNLRKLCNIKRINVYNTIPIIDYSQEIFEKIISGSYNLITFASPSAVYNFVEIMRSKIDFKVLHAVAIGKTTEKALLDSNIKTLITASSSDAEIFADEIANYVDN